MLPELNFCGVQVDDHSRSGFGFPLTIFVLCMCAEPPGKYVSHSFLLHARVINSVSLCALVKLQHLDQERFPQQNSLEGLVPVGGL